MSFGKRGASQSEALRTSTSAHAVSVTVKLAVAAAILLGGAGATYATRHKLAASLYPPLLSSLTPSSEQLDGTWLEGQERPGEAASVVGWSACEMAHACRDGAKIARCKEMRDFRQRMLPETTLPQHRANLYRSQHGKAEDVMSTVVKQSGFCEGPYFIALHDANVAERKYLASSQIESTKRLQASQRFVAALERVQRKIVTRDRTPLDTEAEAAERCLDKKDAESQLTCFLDRVQGLNSGDRAADILRSARRD